MTGTRSTGDAAPELPRDLEKANPSNDPNPEAATRTTLTKNP